MNEGLTVTCEVHFGSGRRSRKTIEEGPAPEVKPVPPGRVPRLSRLMALAIRFDKLIASGEIRHQTEVAHLGQVTRARVTQIMNLLHLAPDIQEQILFLPLTERGRDPIREIMVRQIAAIPDWRKQRRFWRELLAGLGQSERPQERSPVTVRRGSPHPFLPQADHLPVLSQTECGAVSPSD